MASVSISIMMDNSYSCYMNTLSPASSQVFAGDHAHLVASYISFSDPHQVSSRSLVDLTTRTTWCNLQGKTCTQQSPSSLRKNFPFAENKTIGNRYLSSESIELERENKDRTLAKAFSALRHFYEGSPLFYSFENLRPKVFTPTLIYHSGVYDGHCRKVSEQHDTHVHNAENCHELKNKAKNLEPINHCSCVIPHNSDETVAVEAPKMSNNDPSHDFITDDVLNVNSHNSKSSGRPTSIHHSSQHIPSECFEPHEVPKHKLDNKQISSNTSDRGLPNNSISNNYESAFRKPHPHNFTQTLAPWQPVTFDIGLRNRNNLDNSVREQHLYSQCLLSIPTNTGVHGFSDPHSLNARLSEIRGYSAATESANNIQTHTHPDHQKGTFVKEPNLNTRRHSYMIGAQHGTAIPCGKTLPVYPGMCENGVYLQVNELSKIHADSDNVHGFFECSLCDTVCTTALRLKSHLRIHSTEKSFKCDCGRAFTRNEELTRHKRIHSGHKPFKCLMCNKTFGRKDHLKKHKTTHLHTYEKKIHACEITGCLQRYTRSDALARHQWAAHGIKARSSNWRSQAVS